MTTDNDTNEIEMQGLLERLVASELDEANRARVLAWLDADAGRWRLCGLACLEAQTWSETIGAWTSGETMRGAAAISPVQVHHSRERRIDSPLRMAALAAGLLIAFSAGLLARGMVARPGPNQASADSVIVESTLPGSGVETVEAAAPGEPLMATVSLPSAAVGTPSAEVRFPVVKGDAVSRDHEPVLPELPDYVRRQWERRGFKFDAERRFLLARLPDGEQVAVPIERLLVSYVGNKVY
jgi:hypothetical protein